MQRLLETALSRKGEHEGIIEVNYDQQWRTAWKAHELGYAEGEYPYTVTQKGRDWLVRKQKGGAIEGRTATP